MKKLLLATVASGLVIGAGIFFLFNQHRELQSGSKEAKGPGFTLFGGIGSSGAPDSKTKIQFAVPTATLTTRGRTEFGTQGDMLDLEGLTVAQYVAKYRAKARTDPKVAYNVYSAEHLCADLNRIKIAATEAPQKTDADYQQMVQDATDACVGMTPALMDERHQYLLRAAQAGVKGAALSYIFEAPLGWHEGEPVPNESKTNAIAFLQLAGSQGDANAWYYLSRGYLQGTWTEKDTEKALMYEVAAVEINSPLQPGNTAVKRLSQGLSPDQITAAIQQGKALAARAKARSS